MGIRQKAACLKRKNKIKKKKKRWEERSGGREGQKEEGNIPVVTAESGSEITEIPYFAFSNDCQR